jgi:PEP-CTERM motif
MFRSYRSICIALFAMILVAGVAQSARGDFVTSLTVSVTQQPGGLFEYDYTLKDEAASDLPVFQLSLNVAPSANLSSLAGPSGWDVVYNPGDIQVLWSSEDSSTDILPENIGLFSFSSAGAASLQDYLIAGISDSPPDLETNSGQILGPGVSSVPEPSALILLGVGVLAVIGYFCSGARNECHSCWRDKG